MNIFFGINEAIRLREEGWSKIKFENWVLISPESTINRKLPRSVKSREKALMKSVDVRIVENITSKKSLEKNLLRIKQGIQVRTFPHRGFSLVIRDRETVILELPCTQNNLINIKFQDKKAAQLFRKYFLQIWRKSNLLTKGNIEKLANEIPRRISNS